MRSAASGVEPSTEASSSPSMELPKVVSRSITSRSMMISSKSSSRQMVIAWKVRGLSHSPEIIVLRPASIRLAIAISPSRESNSTEPISRRYMRTGSSVRSRFSAEPAAAVTSREVFTSTISVDLASSSSASSASITLMPISESIDITSSICSEDT